MPWIQAHLIIPKENTSTAELVMETLGAVSITLGDAQDEPVLETLPDEIRLWSLVKLTALFEFSPGISDLIRQQINQAFNQDISQQLEIEVLEDQEWERAWLEYFEPLKFGEHLWICPTGQKIEEPEAVIIDLDPGLAFGTGTHPTTALCLEWLDQHHPQNKNVIDFGCGSGILAIAALKLGADKAVGIDYDPQALIASRDNAEKNRVSDRLEVMKTAPQNLEKADILIANILAGVLIELAETIASLVKPGGKIILSGILPEQADEVADAYRCFFNMEPAVEKNDWIRLQGQRN